MGLEALPHQTTIFPIQMNGWSYDYMLAMDDTNCPKRANLRKDIDMKKKAYDIANTDLPKMKELFDKHGWDTMCDYVNWAFIESVELKDEVPKVD